jgi:hypothetical protein
MTSNALIVAFVLTGRPLHECREDARIALKHCVALKLGMLILKRSNGGTRSMENRPQPQIGTRISHSTNLKIQCAPRGHVNGLRQVP